MESSVDYESSVEDQTLESGNSNTIYYDVVEEGRQPLPVCHFSHYEIRHGLDRQFLCHMPIVIGSLAIFIALGEIWLWAWIAASLLPLFSMCNCDSVQYLPVAQAKFGWGNQRYDYQLGSDHHWQMRQYQNNARAMRPRPTAPVKKPIMSFGSLIFICNGY